MDTFIFKELSEKQLETISGGNFMTWRCNYHAPSGSNEGSGGSNNTFGNINIGYSKNTSIIQLNNVYLVDSALIINVYQTNS